MDMTLNEKQKAFCEEYIKDLNATQACIRAGYAAKTANISGAKFLAKTNIKNYINKLLKQRSERTQIDADWLLNRLAQEADADASDLYDENGDIKPVDQWPVIWRKGLVSGFDVETVVLEGKTVARIKKIKISDRVKRLELIGRHIGVKAFEDRVSVTGLDALADRIARAKGRCDGDK